MGLTVAALVALYIKHEVSYDNFHHYPGQTYRIVGEHGGSWFSFLTIKYSDYLTKQGDKDVVKLARFRRTPGRYVVYNESSFPENKVLVTDTRNAFFEIFKHDFIEGDPARAFIEPYKVILTETTARKYFGDESALGKELTVDSLLLTVDGVIADTRSNSHIYFDLLINLKDMPEHTSAAATYVVLNSKADISGVQRRLMAMDTTGLSNFSKLTDVEFQPIESIHLNSNLTYELRPPGNKAYLYILSVVAGLLLVITITNYMNLSVAMYANRGTEIGVRKTIGAGKIGLGTQFMLEAMIQAMLSFGVALVAVDLSMPFFKLWLGIAMDSTFLYSISSMLLLVTMALATGLLSGLYPAIVMARFNVLRLFRSSTTGSRQGLRFRKALVLTQFSLLISLLTATFIIDKQLGFMTQSDLGFNKDGILKIYHAWKLGEGKFQSFKTELLKHKDITMVADGFSPGDEDYPGSYQLEGTEVVHKDAIIYAVDHDYFELLGIEGSGTYFEEGEGDHPKASAIINRTLAKKLDLLDPEAETIITSPGAEWERSRKIRGVFNDFNFFSLHQEIPPMMLIARESGTYVNGILIEMNMGNAGEVVAYVEKTWLAMSPEGPISHRFMDDDLQLLYERENQLASLTTNLSMVALFLALMGLFGLTSYLVSLRIKEIGIRKVMGASLSKIFWLLSREFIFIIIVASWLATIISWTAMESWLENFTYRIDINPVVFLVGGLITLAVALCVVSYQTIKAANANPVDALRYE